MIHTHTYTHIYTSTNITSTMAASHECLCTAPAKDHGKVCTGPVPPFRGLYGACTEPVQPFRGLYRSLYGACTTLLTTTTTTTTTTTNAEQATSYLEIPGSRRQHCTALLPHSQETSSCEGVSRGSILPSSLPGQCARSLFLLPRGASFDSAYPRCSR